MELIRHPDEMPPQFKGGVIALGNFDGVHKGHMALVEKARKLAAQSESPSAVMTFEPHPRLLFAPDSAPFRLTSLRLKTRLMQRAGVDYLYVQSFDQSFAAKTPEAFVEDVLIGALQLSRLVVGFNYRFGKGRTGTVETLKSYASQGAFGLTIVDPQGEEADQVYSSSAIRDALIHGDCKKASGMLGRLWELEGRVETGDARGRTIGFPTANVRLADHLHPRKGVYAVCAGIDVGDQTRWIPGVANFGSRPTFDGTNVLLETHLLDFSGDLYSQHLRVALVEHLRDETKFDGIESLKEQINADILRAQDVLASYNAPETAAFLAPPNN